jgi:rhodanese-related sulfurtransferase
MNHFLRTLTWQAPLLAFAAIVLGSSFNLLRADGISLRRDRSNESRFTDKESISLMVSLEEARALFEKDAASFVDARPSQHYEEGHIRGALSLPWQEVETAFAEVTGRLEPEKIIITYCDGEDCDLSHSLAVFLREMGFTNVRVLVNGWTLWQRAQLPVEKMV